MYGNQSYGSVEELVEINTVFDLGLSKSALTQIKASVGYLSKASLDADGLLGLQATIITEKYEVIIEHAKRIQLKENTNKKTITTTPHYKVGIGDGYSKQYISIKEVDLDDALSANYLSFLITGTGKYIKRLISQKVERLSNKLIGYSDSLPTLKELTANILEGLNETLMGRRKQWNLEFIEELDQEAEGTTLRTVIGYVNLLSDIFKEDAQLQWNDKVNKGISNNSREAKITCIAQFPTWRVAILVGAPTSNYYYSNGRKTKSQIRFSVHPQTSPVHDFLDVDRQILLDGSGGFFQNNYEGSAQTLLRAAYFNNDLEDPQMFGDHNSRNQFLAYARRRITPRAGEGARVFSNADIQRSKKLAAKKQTDEKKAKDIKIIVTKKVDKKLDALSATKPITLNGVKYFSDKIEYEGQVLEMRAITANVPYWEEDLVKHPWVAQFIKKNIKQSKWKDFSFDDVFEEFCSFAEKWSGTYKIGDATIVHELREINAATYTSYLSYINGKRINGKEVGACIRRAMCFDTQTAYYAFVESVSKCSLRIHGFLHNGLLFNIAGLGTGSSYFIVRMEIARRKNINYVKIDDAFIRISNINKLERLSAKIQNPKEFLDKMKTGQCGMSSITVSQIGVLISSGKKMYEEAVQKSKQLLEETEKLFKIKEESHRLSDRITIQGYLIKGSKRNYVVDAHNDNSVYDAGSGQRFCIVDKSNDQTGKDQLVNRLYAISNDRLVSKHISTIR
jgi:hypothetical protein